MKPKKHDMRYNPNKDYPFWCYSPEGSGMVFFRTAEGRDAFVADEVGAYLDCDEWNDEVEMVCAGVVTHRAAQIDRQDRPDHLDDDGCDEEGIYWDQDIKYRCDYAMRPISEIK